MDLTVVATPGYFATMGAEYRYLKKRAERAGSVARPTTRRSDTITSLTMGVGEPARAVRDPQAAQADHAGQGQVRQGAGRDRGRRPSP